MALGLVTLNIEYYPDPTKGRPVFNGSVFVGLPDLDPEIEANRVTVQIRQEGNPDVPILPAAQPLQTGAGGVILYNGSPAQLLVNGSYSVKVLNSLGAQVYYIANASPSVDASVIPITVNSKADALLLTINDGQKVFITSTDGGEFTMKAGAAIGTYNDNGGISTGTKFTAGDGSSGFLRDYPNYTLIPEWFGCTGDGVTNDNANMLLAIAAMSNGDIMNFSGSYLLNNNSIVPKSNTTWYLGKISVLLNTAAITYNFIVCIGVTNWELRGEGTIFGYVINDATENGQLLTIAEDCKDIKISGVNFQNAMGDCIYIGTALTRPINIFIDNINIRDARRNGLSITSGFNIRITNSRFVTTFNPDHVTINSGLDIEPNAGQFVENVIIEKCNFTSNYGSGMTIFGGAGAKDAELIIDVTIKNNVFDNNCLAGVGVSGTLNAAIHSTITLRLSILNNITKGLNGRGGIYTDINTDGKVSGNTVTGNLIPEAHDVGVQFLSGITINSCYDCSTTDNKVRKSNYMGMYIFQNFRCITSTNNVNETNNNGISCQSNLDCQIIDNIVANANYTGIGSFNDNYCSILDNRIIDNNVIGLVGANQAGASLLISYSGGNTPTNIRIKGNTVRTINETPTFPCNIVGANIANAYVTGNDFRGTFVNALADTGTGTILTQTDVINL